MFQDRWEGEDEEDVKDNWDDEDEEEVVPEPVVIPKKKTLKEKILEKEKLDQQKKLEKLREKELRERKLTPEEELAEKLERQRLQEESDLSLAKDTFGLVKSSSGLDDTTLKTKEDYEKFKKSLINKLKSVSSEPLYITFLEDLFRELCVPIDIEDLKRVSSSLSALYNEKLKSQRSSNNKKKKAKGTSLKLEKNNMMSSNFDNDDYDDYDDLDDFM